MKKLALILLLCPSFLLQASNDEYIRNRRASQLQIVGKLLSQEKIKDVTINIYNQQELDFVMVVDSDEKFKIKLEEDQFFTMDVVKDGYVLRRFSISTAIREDEDILPQKYTFIMDIQMLPEIGFFDEFYEDFPVALISFDGIGGFISHANYAKHIKEKRSGLEQLDMVMKE